MLALLGLAILVGMYHALEADHLAAVSSLATGKTRLPDIIAQGITWGIGHTATLFLFAGAALTLGQAIPEGLATQLETAVGIMLIGLGGHVLWRMWRDRVHFHAHRHETGEAHFHAHSHASDSVRHDRSRHAHLHRFNLRTLLVGMTHGMAGSAALLLLTVSESRTAGEGLAYVLLFGLGSMLGMVVVSAAIGLPLTLTARFMTWTNRGLQLAIGAITMFIGASVVHSTIFSGQF